MINDAISVPHIIVAALAKDQIPLITLTLFCVKTRHIYPNLVGDSQGITALHTLIKVLPALIGVG